MSWSGVLGLLVFARSFHDEAISKPHCITYTLTIIEKGRFVFRRQRITHSIISAVKIGPLRHITFLGITTSATVHSMPRLEVGTALYDICS
jgi:hypothetical protein